MKKLLQPVGRGGFVTMINKTRVYESNIYANFNKKAID